jgi:hypothetical protein
MLNENIYNAYYTMLHYENQILHSHTLTWLANE